MCEQCENAPHCRLCLGSGFNRKGPYEAGGALACPKCGGTGRQITPPR